jgi:hypothetical protein
MELLVSHSRSVPNKTSVEVLGDCIEIRIEDVPVHREGEGGASVSGDSLNGSRRRATSNQRGGRRVTEDVPTGESTACCVSCIHVPEASNDGAVQLLCERQKPSWASAIPDHR